MALRLRRVDGVLVTLCAAETDPMDGDFYLNDEIHYSLSLNFMRSRGDLEEDDEYSKLQDSQKLRDAQKELEKWLDRVHRLPLWKKLWNDFVNKLYIRP